MLQKASSQKKRRPTDGVVRLLDGVVLDLDALGVRDAVRHELHGLVGFPGVADAVLAGRLVDDDVLRGVGALLHAEAVRGRRERPLVRTGRDLVVKSPRAGQLPATEGVREVEVGLAVDARVVVADEAVVVDPVREDLGPAFADAPVVDPAERDEAHVGHGGPVREEQQEPEDIRAPALARGALEVLACVDVLSAVAV